MRLSTEDEELCEAIVAQVELQTRADPSMDGRCHRVHGEEENQRIARAAIRGVNIIMRRRGWKVDFPKAPR